MVPLPCASAFTLVPLPVISAVVSLRTSLMAMEPPPPTVPPTATAPALASMRSSASAATFTLPLA